MSDSYWQWSEEWEYVHLDEWHLRTLRSDTVEREVAVSDIVDSQVTTNDNVDREVALSYNVDREVTVSDNVDSQVTVSDNVDSQVTVSDNVDTGQSGEWHIHAILYECTAIYDRSVLLKWEVFLKIFSSPPSSYIFLHGPKNNFFL